MKYEFNNHISTRFDTELESLRTLFLSMGGLVEKQIADALHALLDGNMTLADSVIARDAEVNDYEQELDEDIEKILARRQPTAIDLRLILMLSKSITDLERMGDEAIRIARSAKLLFEEHHPERGYREVRHIGNQVRVMIHDVLDAFARLDAEQAFMVKQGDLDIDAEYRAALRTLVDYSVEHSEQVPNTINVMWVLRAVERIGDHTSNIAEQVIYVISGDDVRHTHMDIIRKKLIEEGNMTGEKRSTDLF